MEMMITQVTSPQTQAQTTGSMQGAKGTGGGAFQQTLEQQINGESAQGASNSQSAPLMAVLVHPEAVATAGAASAVTLEDLISVIDGLIDQLDAPASEAGQTVEAAEQELSQLEAALEQMTALLALLGVPVQLAKPIVGADALAENVGGEAESQAVHAAYLRSGLQDMLLQLQEQLQQGVVKLVQKQDSLTFVGQQLQALTAIMEGASMDTDSKQTKSTANQQQLFTVQSAPQTEASSLLQRLSQRALHPSYISVSVHNQENAAVASEYAQTESATVPLTPMGGQVADPLRVLPQAANNTAPAVTSYIMADEFAQSMTGLIVQKFDVTAINGISEAKLMLFPEHLGQVDVRITMQNGALTAIFQTDTVMAKEMLDNQMAQLKSALQAQGLNVDKLEVSHGQSADQWFGQQQGQGRERQHSSSRQAFRGEAAAAEAQFESEMIEQAAEQGLGYGRALNVKA